MAIRQVAFSGIETEKPSLRPLLPAPIGFAPPAQIISASAKVGFSLLAFRLPRGSASSVFTHWPPNYSDGVKGRQFRARHFRCAKLQPLTLIARGSAE